MRAVATELTNEKCSFWHFRFDANVAMKAEVMARALPKSVTKVYLLNQDYLFGQSVQRDVKKFLAKVRPDIQVVGDELIPLGKVKDFAPYISKIKASGAQALLTGNWGPDMNLLIKAGIESGISLGYYTFYAHLAGGAVAIGPGGDGKVRSVQSFNENVAAEIGNAEAEAWTKAFRDKYPFDFYAAGFRTIFEYVQEAVKKAGAVDATKIAFAMEGMKTRTSSATIGDAQGRSPAHQRVLRRRLQEGREVRLREDRPGLGDRGDHPCQGSGAAHHLQDEASEVT